MHKKSLGFTLIELLVVVAIISLLSSLSSVIIKDSREKVKATTVRTEVANLVTGIELYKAEKGNYPTGDLNSDNQPFIYYQLYRSLTGSTEAVGTASGAQVTYFKNKIIPNFVKNLPNIKDEETFSGTILQRTKWAYAVNNPISFGNKFVKCGSEEIKPYVILIRINKNKYLEETFKSLPYSYDSQEFKCFSL